MRSNNWRASRLPHHPRPSPVRWAHGCSGAKIRRFSWKRPAFRATAVRNWTMSHRPSMLVEMVLRQESDGPSAREVLAWAAACDPDDRFGNLPRSFRVGWLDGVIDYRKSYCQVAALAPSAGISIYTLKDLGPNMTQANFRAPVSMQPTPRIIEVVAPAARAADGPADC